MKHFGITFIAEITGIIIGSLLCLLQATEKIDIGWFWATFPFWIALALTSVVMFVIGFVYAIWDIVDMIKRGTK